MRIAVFHNLPSGGAKRALQEWTRRLAADHAVDVYTLSTGNHEFSDLRPYVQQHQVFDFAPRALFARPFGRLNQLQRWRDLRDLETINHRIAARINAGRYDVVFANPCVHTFIPALLEHLQAPSAYYLHEPFGPGFPQPIERPHSHRQGIRRAADRIDPLIALYRRHLQALQRRCVHKTTVLLSNSQFTSEHMRAAFGVDAVWCPLGVDTDMFRPEPETPRESFVLSVGELSPRKGFDFLVESLATIAASRRPSLTLACNAVREDEQRYVDGLATQHGVRVEIVRNAGADTLRRLHAQSLFCVYAPVMEPFGLVPLEAMACGRAVVGVREGGVQESVVHGTTGLLVDRSPTAFGKAIESLLDDPARAEDFGRRGRECVVRQWTWDNSTTRLTALLTACAAAKARP